MEPLVYVMAIMGCGDDGTACQQARIAPVVYQSQQQCQVAMEGMLRDSLDLSYPVVSATCQQRGERMARIAVEQARRG